jgi:hypothetical protein
VIDQLGQLELGSVRLAAARLCGTVPMVAARQHLNRLEVLAGDHHPSDHELATSLARIRDAVDAITCCCPSERDFVPGAIASARDLSRELVARLPPPPVRPFDG